MPSSRCPTRMRKQDSDTVVRPTDAMSALLQRSMVTQQRLAHAAAAIASAQAREREAHNRLTQGQKGRWLRR
jgi:hypothetical protein